MGTICLYKMNVIDWITLINEEIIQGSNIFNKQTTYGLYDFNGMTNYMFGKNELWELYLIGCINFQLDHVD